MDRLTHFNKDGRATMVDVSDKEESSRLARAYGKVLLNSQTFARVSEGHLEKGDVLGTAQIAGIMGAKRTPDIIPMCHPILIDGVDIEYNLDEDEFSIEIFATVTTTGKTGVEMEALTAVSAAALTIYDMVKAVQKDVEIGEIKLLKKTGGRGGDYEYDSGSR